MIHLAKRSLGSAVSAFNPQCQFGRMVFIIGHMRCGSTALSNILCSRDDVSGYGEAHIAYTGRAALGVLALNQLRRRVWRAGAPYLFDKILHNRYDDNLDPAFFDARAIFMLRRPVETILSIRTLFARIDSGEFVSDAQAAAYYEERLQSMARLWERFPASRRFGITHEHLTTDPDGRLDNISRHFNFDPPLANRYIQTRASQLRGAGDPLASHRFDSIVPSSRSSTITKKMRPLNLPQDRIEALNLLFRNTRSLLTS